MEVNTHASSLSNNFLCIVASLACSDSSHRQQKQTVDPKGPTPSPQLTWVLQHSQELLKDKSAAS